MPNPRTSAHPRTLPELRGALKDLEERFAQEKKTPEWWTVSGYRQILDRALDSIHRHEKRAKRVYGNRAASFEDCSK